MKKRVEFEHLLYGTIIDSTCSQEVAKTKIKSLQEWIIDNIPHRLYRFRANTKYAVDAFRNDEVWGSNLWELNDPYECIPFYNLDLLQKILENELSFERILKLICSIKEGNISEELAQALGSEFVARIRSNIPDHLDEMALKFRCKMIKQQIITFIIKNFNEISNQFFSGIIQAESQRYIACFSEQNDSPLMWGHYSNGHRGFCLEYDFKSILKPCQEGCADIKACNNFMIFPSIAPVIYGKERFNATSHLLTVIQALLATQIKTNMNLYYGDTLLISKCLLTKSFEWEYEKEWRLFSPPFTDSMLPYKAIFSLKPTAVYIGRKSSIEQAQLLNGICKEKNITCYQMIQNYSGHDFTLFPMLYEDYIKNAF